MRVVVVDPGHQVPPYDRALAAALAAAGEDVTLVVGPALYYPVAPPPGVEVRTGFGRLLSPRLPLARRAFPRRALRAAGYGPELAAFVRRVRAERPDVVHLQWSLAPWLDALAAARMRAAGVATVYTAHNALPHEPRPWHRRAARRLARGMDRVIVHSEATRRRVTDHLGLAPERVTVVPLAPYAPDRPIARAEARRALGIPVDGPVALFFGQFRPYKGFDALLEAWPRVRASLPEARLVAAGPAGGAAEARLQADVRARGLAPSVDLRIGHVGAAEHDALFAAADVVVLPYRDTDDSGVLAAARGHGRAVVATTVGGLPEALAAGGGLCVPPGDGRALAVALVEVLGRRERREALEAEARRAAAAWTWADVAARTRGVYRDARAEADR